jgi:hypothetical protein
VLDALHKGIAQRESDFQTAADDAERRAVVRALRRISLEVRALHQVTPWIDSARGATVGLGLVYLVDEMVDALLRQPADVVMTPSTTYMYWTLPKPFEDVLTGLGVGYPSGDAPVIVAYPIQEPDSLFLHLIIGHELGHSAVRDHDLFREVLRRDPDKGATAKTLGDAVTEYLKGKGGTTRPVAVGKVRAMLVSWVTELLCDGLAAAFLGPSFLFTSAAFSTPFDPVEASETHPPFTLRTRLLIDRLDASGWRATVELAAPKTLKWIESAAPKQPGRPAYFDLLEEAIVRLEPTILDVITDHVGAEAFLPAAHAPVEKELATLLEHNVLPAQLIDRTAAPRRSIILAGWIHAFATHGDDPERFAGVVGDRDQQRFLTKALEMSVILDRWLTL